MSDTKKTYLSGSQKRKLKQQKQHSLEKIPKISSFFQNRMPVPSTSTISKEESSSLILNLIASEHSEPAVNASDADGINGMLTNYSLLEILINHIFVLF